MLINWLGLKGLASTTRSLDAWMLTLLPVANQRFLEKPSVSERRVYVDRPVVTGGGNLAGVDEVMANCRKLMLSRSAKVAQIIGSGGTGKSALAVQLGLRMLEQNVPPAERSQRWPALPLFVFRLGQEPMEKILEEKVAALTGGAEMPDWLLSALLKKGRAIPVFDAVTEMEPGDQEKLRAWLDSGADGTAMALLTCRDKIALKEASSAEFRPVLIGRDEVLPFSTDYLRELTKEQEGKKGGALTYKQQAGIIDATVKMLEQSAVQKDITPLFLRMACDRGIRAYTENSGPATAELKLSFAGLVKDTEVWPLGQNDQERDQARQSDLPRLGALAKAMVKDDYKPRDIPWTEAADLLAASFKLSLKEAEGCLRKYVQAGLLREIGGGNPTFLKFSHDTITEYMAAGSIFADCNTHSERWNDLKVQLEKVAAHEKNVAVGGWESLRGISSALAETLSDFNRPRTGTTPDKEMEEWLVEKLNQMSGSSGTKEAKDEDNGAN